MPRITTPRLLLLALCIHIGLILYAHHVDSHPERFGGLKYTDVDWRVVSDGAELIFRGGQGCEAHGWLVRLTGWRIGNPYARQTFRYTPLLPLILSPTLVHPLLGKLTLSTLSLLVPLLLLARPSAASFWPTHLLWTLNPFVLNITTRGSPEAIVVLLVVGFLVCLRKAQHLDNRRPRSSDDRAVPSRVNWEVLAGLVYSLAISYKIYPVIYAPAIWAHLAKRHGWLGLAVWRFGISTLFSLLLINGLLWSIWGQPFLEHTFFYHLHRLDHRHNFSPYFYSIYLSLFPTRQGTFSPINLPTFATRIIQHPLTSFVPQFGLVTVAGIVRTPRTPRTGLEMAMFVQTAGFVAFNKVCTSQYFVWVIPFLPLILPNIHLSRQKTALMLSVWVGAQAIWLGTAYQLEFMAKAVHLQLWTASLGVLAANIWVLGEVIEGSGSCSAFRRKAKED